MPFSVTKLSSLPTPVRAKRIVLENSEEWIAMRQRIDKGLKPYEAAVVSFSPKQLHDIGIKTVDKVFMSIAAEYIKLKKLKGLDLWKYRAEDGSLVIVAADRGLLSHSEGVATEPQVTASGALKRKPGRPPKVHIAA